MKIALSAAGSKLGSAILKSLSSLTDSSNLVGIARTPSKVTIPGIEVRKADYNSKEDFRKALEDVEVLLIVSGFDHPDKRIIQHRNIIESAKECGVRKLVYTSILGAEEKTDFSPIVQSNRQTEEDIKTSGLAWIIGRNSLYIEPDFEYLEEYKKAGKISNCAGEGRCAYTSRDELGLAYAKLLLDESLNGKTLNMAGHPISQTELVNLLNEALGLSLSYEYLSPEEYKIDRIESLGEFLGTVISGIYDGIRKGGFDVVSDFEKATGRPHKSPEEMLEEFLNPSSH